MNKLTVAAALCISSLTLAGCGVFGNDGYFRDRSNDYQQADSLPPLQMPDGITAKHQEELYEIPQIAGDELAEGDFEVPRPQALSINASLDRVKIQKLGSNRWVLVSQPPEEVWPQLHYFLRTSGLRVEMSDASAGILETAWMTFNESPDTKDKYRLQIETGVQPDTTEIHVRHLSTPAEAPVGGTVNWPQRSSSPEREGWMIDEMSTALATDTSGASASLVAQAIGGDTVKVRLREPVGLEPYISMGLEMERAWATVAHAVNAGAYRLHREDSDIGLFYVTYDEDRELANSEEEGGGWFFWNSGDKEDKLADSADQVTLQQILAGIDPDAEVESPLFREIKGLGVGASPDEAYPGYLVVIRGNDDEIEVRIRDTRGQPLSRAKASQLLLSIQQNLI
ncbi:outer membrane protein assembly factor BamC [Microbulbifer sp. 2205BS26-8]|uniref:outer membrane protein assembly factor BamC n=1 Tax=Microbulbifer sp. 2205BS26-8 TaxID=3064386 RepID=UPI00273DFC2F|nr:outer membrane protein assembly factor BamC [Microbulbifer sp. 2205BS26-8]MDP5209561.1 outer membrane protein assembly factor BamC [Microbulbifer sp. 2205BS26-8]